ncbi:hypothetical protein [Persicitalea jodogahamensis]|uniref:DUF937 domain-containing protein n=1 Tax=Persicitalea jodogahamensis TaxID=402147 RepID=A0A8J3GC28_9BACT|nr:hypothetical protein [Persicitalea jodogahamensis]GHB81623.1 hypothetical protein GCM10007390_40660 [Persicitalea jodogahamensis]
MLEQIMGLIQENSQEAVVRNPEVPNQHNDDVMQTLMGSIMGGMQQEAQSGNVGGLMGLLSGKSVNTGQSSSLMSNPIVAGIAGKAIHSIMEKFGMSNSAASGIVASVLPGVIASLINKTSNSQDGSIDFNSILGNLMGGSSTSNSGVQTGGGGFDFNQIGYALADGKLDMNDLMRMGGSMLGGNNTDDQKSGGMDLGGMLGGLFGK